MKKWIQTRPRDLGNEYKKIESPFLTPQRYFNLKIYTKSQERSPDIVPGLVNCYKKLRCIGEVVICNKLRQIKYRIT